MGLVSKQLGQVRPASTAAVSLYSPSGANRAIIKTLLVCNTSGVDATFRVFHDDNGTTYDETTALFWDQAIAAGVSFPLTEFIAANDVTGNIAVRSSVGNALTFTLYGAEL